MARTKVKESSSQIQAMIFDRARDDASMRRELMLFSRRVHKYWRRIAPVGDPSGVRYVENFGGPLPKHWNQTDSNAGSYKAGIVNRKGKPDLNGLPTRMISATDHKSHWIEYGTGGTTPTPEFACRQRTATRFGAMGGVTARRGLVNKSGRRGTTRLNISGRPSGKPGKAKTYDAVEPAA
jgi:hypothetical protein